jgi:hypothetical protein
MQPIGHIDFYPNGGVRQPGCGTSVLDSIEKERGSVLYGKTVWGKNFYLNLLLYCSWVEERRTRKSYLPSVYVWLSNSPNRI